MPLRPGTHLGREAKTISRVSWDVMPDGERFIMLESTAEPYVATQMNVVLNGFEELKERVPTGGR